MLFDQITRDLAKGITVLQGEERREEERSQEGGGGVAVGQGYRKEGLSSAKSEAVEKCWPTWRWSEEARGGEERGIQVILLLGEMDSFIITPLAWFLPGGGCKLTTSTCSWLSFIMLPALWQIEQQTFHIQSLSTCTHNIIYAIYISIKI